MTTDLGNTAGGTPLAAMFRGLRNNLLRAKTTVEEARNDIRGSLPAASNNSRNENPIIPEPAQHTSELTLTNNNNMLNAIVPTGHLPTMTPSPSDRNAIVLRDSSDELSVNTPGILELQHHRNNLPTLSQ